MADKKPKQLMVVINSFAVAQKNGPPRMITPDTPLYSTDPIVKKNRANFITLEEYVARTAVVVHHAVAVPGEAVRAPGADVKPSDKKPSDDE